MAVKTKDEYIESLRGIKRNAFIHGERVENIVDHPINRPAINAMGESYAVATEEKSKEIGSAISHLSGERINRYNGLNKSVDDMLQRAELERMNGYRTGVGCPRATGIDALNAFYSIGYEVDEKYGTEYLKRFDQWLRRVEEEDLAVSGAMTDVKGDRSKRPLEQDDPDMYLHVVKRTEDGVVVRGAKAHQTGAINCHEHLVMPTRGMREDEKDYAICFSVPVDTPNLYHIYGRQPSDTRKLEEGASIDLGMPRFGGCETLMIFDDVFVPWEHVYLDGEIEFTWPLVNRFAIGHRASYGVAGGGAGEVFIGAVAFIAEANGLLRKRTIWDKIADLIIMTETLYGLGLSAMLKGKPTPSGIYFPDYVLGGVAKYSATILPFLMARVAQDICGGLVATMPSEKDLRNDEVGKFIEKYLRGVSEIPTEDRMRMVRLIECASLGTFAADLLTMGLHGAGSPEPQKMMILADYQEKIPRLINLARYHASIVDELNYP
jgi:4-hydroxybutyryl-CoA dehydratase/vinylacetyl-CoA-Delta-isomerase